MTKLMVVNIRHNRGASADALQRIARHNTIKRGKEKEKAWGMQHCVSPWAKLTVAADNMHLASPLETAVIVGAHEFLPLVAGGIHIVCLVHVDKMH